MTLSRRLYNAKLDDGNGNVHMGPHDAIFRSLLIYHSEEYYKVEDQKAFYAAVNLAFDHSATFFKETERDSGRAHLSYHEGIDGRARISVRNSRSASDYGHLPGDRKGIDNPLNE